MEVFRDETNSLRPFLHERSAPGRGDRLGDASVYLANTAISTEEEERRARTIRHTAVYTLTDCFAVLNMRLATGHLDSTRLRAR